MTATRRPREGAFISYARQDGEAFARALVARLAAEVPDVPAWLDRSEIEGGVGWWNQIEQQLERAEFLILVMTPGAMQSENTRREWRSARQRGVCVYPIKGSRDTALDYETLPNWMRKAHFYDLEKEWPKLVAHLRRGCVTTRVPFMAPPLPPSFVARPRETETLINLLRTRDANDPVAITTALRGAGGFGKTTLAAAICHDDRILDAFDDGILWVTLGQSPNLVNELLKVYAALTGDRPGFVDVEDAVRELGLQLEHKNCLIVIDDAWNASHVQPFLRGGRGCARLITTRLFEVAAEAQRVEVDRMDPGEATALLLARAGIDPANAAPFRRLAMRLGEWALPIKLAGSAIRQRLERGDTEAKALDYVERAFEKRGVTAFDSDKTERSDAVQHTIGASLNLLSPLDQQRCAELAVFPEDVAIPLAAVGTLWQLDDIDTEDLARKLDDLALLDFDLRSGVLRMHDVLRAFLGGRLPAAPAVHARLVDAWGDPRALPTPYAWRRYVYHLIRAGRLDQARTLLLNPDWLRAKMNASDVHALVADYDVAPAGLAAEAVRDALRLSAPALVADPSQLRTQLNARLLGREEAEIAALRSALVRGPQDAWIRLLHPSLDAPGGMLVMTLIGHQGEVTSLATDADQRFVFSGSADGTVRVWHQRDGQLVWSFGRLGDLAVRAVATTDAGDIVVAGSANGILYLYDVARGERLHAFWDDRSPAPYAVAVSADGRRAVSGSRDRTVRVWDLASRTFLSALGGTSGHKDAVLSVALSADGRRAASGSDDHSVKVWDLESGLVVWTLDAHTGPVNAVAMTRDGRHLLSGSSDGTIRLWDLAAGRCLRTLTGHAGAVTAVAFASTGWRALSGSADRSARLWDLDTGGEIATCHGHADTLTAVVINDAGTNAATASVDRSIKMWRLAGSRAPVAPATVADDVRTIVFSPDGRLCASGSSDGSITIREVETARVVRVIAGHSAPVQSLAFTEDGTCVLSAGLDNKFWLWFIDTGEAVWIPVAYTGPMADYALSATARYLMTSGLDRFVHLWDVPSGAMVEKYGTRRLFDHLIPPAPQRSQLADTEENRDSYLPGEPVFDVALVRMSGDGRYALISATTRQIHAGRAHQSGNTALAPPELEGACLLVLDLTTGEIESHSIAQTVPVTAFAVDSTAARLLWARPDHSIEAWDLQTQSRLATMRGHDQKVNAVSFSGDGTVAVSVARDRSARVWNPATGAQIAAFTADAALRSLAVSPDGGTIAVGDVAGRVHFLKLEAPT